MKSVALLVFFFTVVYVHNEIHANTKETSKLSSETDMTNMEVEVEKKVNERLAKIKSKDVVDLLKEIMEKEKQIKTLEDDLRNREELLKVAQNDLKSSIEKFNTDKNKIIGCIDQNEKDKQTRIEQQINVLSNMKPMKAAEVLSVQDSELAVKIMSGMDPVKVSKIFNLMDKEISARLQKQYLLMKK